MKKLWYLLQEIKNAIHKRQEGYLIHEMYIYAYIKCNYLSIYCYLMILYVFFSQGFAVHAMPSYFYLLSPFPSLSCPSTSLTNPEGGENSPSRSSPHTQRASPIRGIRTGYVGYVFILQLRAFLSFLSYIFTTVLYITFTFSSCF